MDAARAQSAWLVQILPPFRGGCPARGPRHHEGAPAVDVGGHPDQSTGDLPDERLPTREDAQIGAAVRKRYPERLTFAAGDVGAVRGGRCQHGERHRLDHGNEEGACRVGQAAGLRHRLEEAQEARVRDHDARDRPLGVGEHSLESDQIGRARSRSFSHQRNLVGHEICAAEVRAQRLAVMRMDTAADQHTLAARGAAGHQRPFGRGRRPVVVRRGDDVHARQLAQQRLVLVDRLERALADLGLVRRVGGVELAAQEELVHDCRNEMAIGSGAEEAHQIDPIPLGETAQPAR
jgi:hypothetical protein